MRNKAPAPYPLKGLVICCALFASIVTLDAKKTDDSFSEEDQSYWAFQPIESPLIPETRNASWPRNPIDAFVLARLETHGLQPSPEASRQNLIRRATLDMHGVPPTVAEVDAFLSDSSSNAYERLIDRLLESHC